MKYISTYGTVYRLSDRNFRKFCRDGMEGNLADNFDYYSARKIAEDVEVITDWEYDDFRSALGLMVE